MDYLQGTHIKRLEQIYRICGKQTSSRKDRKTKSVKCETHEELKTKYNNINIILLL